MLCRLRRMMFGSHSEKLRREVEQTLLPRSFEFDRGGANDKKPGNVPGKHMNSIIIHKLQRMLKMLQK